MYTVRIIPPDLRHEETIIQAANALDCLQKTISSVFERIDARITRNSAKAQQLSERIEKAQRKVQGLVGTKKAIHIFAPARFPASHVFSDLPLTFRAETATAADMVEQHQTQQYDVQSGAGMTSATIMSPHEKLVFFHVRTDAANAGSNNNSSSKSPRPNQRQGLGDVPSDLRSVSSLLRFSTDEMIYGIDSADCDLNSWKRARLFKHQRQTKTLSNQKQLLEPSPHSLAHRNQKQLQTPSMGLRYTPRLHEAPEIDLPLDLPDLPGIADDLHFEGKAQQHIAPSLYIDNLPELPELQQQEEEEKQQKTIEANENIPNKTSEQSVIKKTVAKSMQPPPPPPPPPSMLAPPPPPPPLPPTFNAPPTPAVPSVPAASFNSRSELMDAIRQAGGARGGRLRAAAPLDAVDSQLNSNMTKSAKPTKPAGDLMADLHNKLTIRRKGISGNKEQQNNSNTGALSTSSSGDPVISRLSALIPPPPPAKTRQGQSDEDDDDAEDDWVD